MRHDSLWQEKTDEQSGLRVRILFQPAVNLALVHNSVPMISELRVTNASGRPAVDTTVTVRMLGNGEELAPVWTRTHDGDLLDGAETYWDDFTGFVPAIPYLRALNEAHPATIAVTVSTMWAPDLHLTIPIRVLAHNEWFNAPIFYDSLAAFVQPNTSAVQSVHGDAAELLRANTGSSSLEGYQNGPERAALIAAAIYESLRARGIRYIDPPASFENTGQKVRTTAQVLEQSFGTCIDLAVTYAACLEEAGLRPLLWLVDGHAFAGFLSDDASLPHPTMTEPNALVNLVESGKAVAVDAVYYNQAEAGDFKGAMKRAREYFATPEKLNGVVDVVAARKSGIRPLPSTDDVAPTPQPRPADLHDVVLALPDELKAGRNADDLVLDTTDHSPPRVRKWKRALLDLSTRNRLLNLRPSAQVIDLHVPQGGLSELDDIIHSGHSITLVPHDELASIHELQGARRASEIESDVLLSYLTDDRRMYGAISRDLYAKRFKELSRTARTMLEETGSANLYLTLGALIHRTSTGAEARAPLFLLPIRIVGGTGRKPFQITVDTTEVATPNHCLVEWLRLKHNVSIDALESPKLDDSGLDIDHALRGIRAALVENNIDLRVDEVATVAICQFGTFGMWKDLNEHWDILEQSPIVRHLTHHAGESFRDPLGNESLDSVKVDEASVPVPIPADGSQLRAVSLAASGRTFVIEGPPGTGKSQTITNLIAHALERGKTVLFVAEKQAALDVVKKRISKVGLSNFTLDLHGKSQSPSAIREQLKAAIDNNLYYNSHNWDAKVAEYRSKLAPLADYPNKIHSRNGIDQSLWRAFESVLEVGDGPIAPIPAWYVARPTQPWATIRDTLELFSRAAHSLEIRPGSPWSLAGSIPPGIEDQHVSLAVLRFADSIDAALTSSRTRALLERVQAPDDVVALLPQARRQLGRQIPDAATLAWMRSPQFAAGREALFVDIDRAHQNCAPVLRTFVPMFLESGDIEFFIAEAEECDKGLFGKKKKAEQFQRSLAPFAHPDADLAPQAVLPLLRMIPMAREQVAHLRAAVRDLLGPFAPATWNPLAPTCADDLRPVFEYIDDTIRFVDEAPGLWKELESVGFLTEPEIRALDETADAWVSLRSTLGSSDADVARWMNGDHWLAAWQRDSHAVREEAQYGGGQRFLAWSRMSAYLEPLRRAELLDFVEALLTGRIPAAEAPVAFIRGAARASLEERRRTTGVVNFTTALRDGEISDFVRSAEALRDEQVRALPAALLSRRPFQTGALQGEVGELRRALERKRGGATFRNLMARYAHHILAATPCVFVSPTSLAQFIPPGSATFDLVVFDEASQVTVAQAIGALGRGRAAVIVGDSQQMPPSTFGQVSAVDDDEADEDGTIVPEDLESILTECVESGVPRLWLSWHYRSQDETLINFSNQKYYEGRLASLPSPGGDDTAGVEWRRVNGHFNRENRKDGYRTNRVEAEAIVEEIRTRLATPRLAGQSIGVVTFNLQQRVLVQDLLEACEDPLVREQLRPDKEEGIFVKNLENVQGDERDVILFTTAFSKKPGESQLPLQFGPLSRSGGEKRFNVAITRARRKVVIFTSFDPSDIDLSRTKSVGLAHLRGYLEMAAQRVAPRPSVTTNDNVDAVQRSICTALADRGYEVTTNYGLSEFVLDIVVREPDSGHWQVAVMLDGPRWAGRPTVSDRDLTPRLLETLMHWGSSVRVWLPEWIENPGAVLDRIDAAVDTARERRRQYEEQLAREAEARAIEIAEAEARAAEEVVVENLDVLADLTFEKDEPEHMPEAGAALEERHELVAGAATMTAPSLHFDEDVVPSSTERDWHGRGVAYTCAPTAPLGERGDLDRVNSASVRRVITDAVRETVEIEGPILLDRLTRVVAKRFGFERVKAARKEFVGECVPPELIHATPLGSFVWPRQLDRTTWRGFRTTPDDVTRSLNEIAPEEIVNAMNAACMGRELDVEDLVRETMALFNQSRLGGPSRDRLEACLDLGVANGRLIQIGRMIRAGA
ncbi:DUF4011 domain-containing protein [Rhodococcus pyridinivorans]|uniref:DUF4011 domain-containing protein n=1 Tax=Rhodococcus pyridinivorans TaxID=103816 RepID=UPI0036C22749